MGYKRLSYKFIYLINDFCYYPVSRAIGKTSRLEEISRQTKQKVDAFQRLLHVPPLVVSRFDVTARARPTCWALAVCVFQTVSIN